MFAANIDRLKDLLATAVAGLPAYESDAEATCDCRRVLDGLDLPFELRRPMRLTLIFVPSALPSVIPRPSTGRCRRRCSRGVGTGRWASTCTCRSARPAAATATSTPTRPPSCARRLAETGELRGRGARRDRPGRAGAATRAAGVDGLRRRRHPTLLARRRPRLGAAPDRRPVRAGSPTRRSPPRPTPNRSTPAVLPRCARAGSPGSRSACSRPCRTCWPPWTGCTLPGRAADGRSPRRAPPASSRSAWT